MSSFFFSIISRWYFAIRFFFFNAKILYFTSFLSLKFVVDNCCELNWLSSLTVLCRSSDTTSVQVKERGALLYRNRNDEEEKEWFWCWCYGKLNIIPFQNFSSSFWLFPSLHELHYLANCSVTNPREENGWATTTGTTELPK